MEYFKSTTGEVYAYEEEQVSSGVVPSDYTQMSEKEIETHLSPSKLDLEAWERFWRDSELLRADYCLNKALDEGKSVASWRKYRVALRSLPEHELFPSPDARPVAPDA